MVSTFSRRWPSLRSVCQVLRVLSSDPVRMCSPDLDAHIEPEQVTELQHEEIKAKESAKRRKLAGLPEVDPDALPSTTVVKHMTLGFLRSCHLHGSGLASRSA